MTSWFQHAFGFTEMQGCLDEYNKTRDMFAYDPKTGVLVSKACPDRNFAAGLFETPSLEELRTRADWEAARTSLGGHPLSIEEDIGDVSVLHGLEENRFALFQAASQFNALEHMSENGTPEKGINCYCWDHTQGPACATACAPGTVVRNYFAFEDGDGQTSTRQVQNLGDIERLLRNDEERYFKVKSGYTLASEDALKRLGELLRSNGRLQRDIMSALRIGIQTDTEVVNSEFGYKPYTGPPGEQIVSQAYCSAVSVSYSGCSKGAWEIFARIILHAAYEATLYAGLENALRHPEHPGSRKVFLTALGGGVFGNDMSWIAEAMSKAFSKFKDVGLEVHLVSFGRPTREFAPLLTKTNAVGLASERDGELGRITVRDKPKEISAGLYEVRNESEINSLFAEGIISSDEMRLAKQELKKEGGPVQVGKKQGT